MNEMRIDRLTLKLSGKNRLAARKLAEQIVERLRDSDWAGDWAQAEDSVRVRVQDVRGATADRLAERAATEVVRKLRRTI
jgi:hypothetical protein